MHPPYFNTYYIMILKNKLKSNYFNYLYIYTYSYLDTLY